MKIAAFEVKNFEDRDFACAASYGLEVSISREKLTMDRLSLVQGCEGISILGYSVLDAALLEELKKEGIDTELIHLKGGEQTGDQSIERALQPLQRGGLYNHAHADASAQS